MYYWTVRVTIFEININLFANPDKRREKPRGIIYVDLFPQLEIIKFLFIRQMPEWMQLFRRFAIFRFFWQVFL